MIRENSMTPPAPELRTLRETAGLTKPELAAVASSTLAAVYAWEDGRAWPTIDKLPKLAEALNVDVNALVDSLILTRRRAGI